MREIKFRAWNKGYEYMENFKSHKSGILYAGEEFQVNSGFDSYDDPTFSEDTSDKFIIMQFTGLKDRNGVDIYEGDILTRPMEDGSLNGVVSYEELEGGYLTKGIGGIENYPLCFNKHSASESEVIGNIHENPELLMRENNNAI